MYKVADVLSWANCGLNLEGVGTTSTNAARGRRPHGKMDLGYCADQGDRDRVAAAVHNTIRDHVRGHARVFAKKSDLNIGSTHGCNGIMISPRTNPREIYAKLV